MRGLGLIYVPSRPRTIRSRERATKREVTWYLTEAGVDLRSVVSAHPFIRTKQPGHMRRLGLIYVPSCPRICSFGRATERKTTWSHAEARVDLRSVTSTYPFMRERDETRSNLVSYGGWG